MDINERERLKLFIYEYRKESEVLEMHRVCLAKGIGVLLKSEIIPVLNPQLPTGYTINPDRGGLVGIKESPEKIPTKFGLELRLDYQGQPLPPDKLDKVIELQNGFRTIFSNIATRYGFDSLEIAAEPIQMN